MGQNIEIELALKDIFRNRLHLTKCVQNSCTRYKKCRNYETAAKQFATSYGKHSCYESANENSDRFLIK